MGSTPKAARDEPGSLIRSQRFHWINPRRPARWQVRGKQSRGQQDHAHGDDHGEIHRPDPVQSGTHGAPDKRGPRKPDRESHPRQQQSHKREANLANKTIVYLSSPRDSSFT